jgi:hypothetical protein|tara:strand:- start:576 stop:2603 length:2028 start_codon:yes stop_codon:yes gene_type:complete
MATTVDTLMVRIEADMSQLRRQLQATQRTTAVGATKIKSSMEIASRGVGNLRKAFFGLGTVIATLGFGALGFSVVRASAEMEDLRASLNSVFQTAEGGQAAFDFIQTFAQRTPFDIQTLSRAFIQLGGAGIAPTEKLLTTFGDAASVTTDKVRTFEALVKVFQRSVGGGLGLEELNIINEAGIPVLKILQDELGLARHKIAEFGQSAEGAAKIMEVLNEGLDARFAGAMANASDNLSVRLSNLGIAANNTLLEIGKGGLNDAIKLTSDNLTTGITRTNNFARVLGSVLGRALVFVNEHFDKLIKFSVGFAGFVLGRSALAAGIGVFQLGKALALAGKSAMVASITFMFTKRAIFGLASALTIFTTFQTQLKELFEQLQLQMELLGFNDFMENAKDFFGNFLTFGDEAKASMEDLEKTMVDALNGADVGHVKDELTVLRQQADDLVNPLKQDEALLKSLISNLETDAIKNSAEDTALFKDAIEILNEKIHGTPPMVEAVQSAIQNFSSGVSDALADMVVNAEFSLESLTNVFKQIQKQIVSAALQFSVINPLINRLMNPTTPLSMATTGGGATVANAIMSFGKAGGGKINAPTIVGERGPELFMPNTGTLKNASDTRSMMRGSPVIVNQNLNIETGVAQTVRAEILTLMPVIQSSTLDAVQNARQRGGAFAASFGA